MSNKLKKTVSKKKKTVVELPPIDSATSEPEVNINNVTNDSKSRKWIKPSQLVALISAFVAIAVTFSISLVLIPYITDQTDEAKAAREQKEVEAEQARSREENQDRLAQESAELDLDSRNEFEVEMAISIDDQEERKLQISMEKEWAPETVENFVRLAYRDYYDNMLFHRIVEQENFAVIQGGDPSGNGSGGETATGEPLVDELWIIEPEVSSDAEAGSSEIINEPEFRAPSLYENFDKETGNVTYRKGLILMAKTNSPDSASSQFFITLEDTQLPADYTVFGVVDDSDFEVLDYISDQVDPVESDDSPGLTRPSKDVRIESVEVL
ncbi:MAG: peptidylprolyl isomerase [Patescibacteria group bacterium]